MTDTVKLSRKNVEYLLVQGKRTAQVRAKPGSQQVRIIRSAAPLSAINTGGSGYEFIQSSAAATWTINHNLGRNPVVSILSTGGIEVEAEVMHISPNQTVVNFASPFAGKAMMR
jgi:hypothetical protein